jgi:hypothetical protein
MVAQVREAMADHGAAGRDVWVTEFGWPTFPGVTDDEQAAYLVRATLLLAAAGVRTACWYTLWDGPNPSDVIPEDQFGLFRWQEEAPADRVPNAKPSYEALVQMVDAVGDLGFIEDLSGGEGAERHLVFGDAAGARVSVRWNPEDTRLPTFSPRR